MGAGGMPRAVICTPRTNHVNASGNGVSREGSGMAARVLRNTTGVECRSPLPRLFFFWGGGESSR